MVDGTPDPHRFAETVGPVIRTARTGDRRVLAFGEMVALLWAEGNREAAIRLEQLWNDLARRETFALLCAYPISHFDDAGHAKPFAEINAAHTWVTPAESYSIVEAVMIETRYRKENGESSAPVKYTSIVSTSRSPVS